MKYKEHFNCSEYKSHTDHINIEIFTFLYFLKCVFNVFQLLPDSAFIFIILWSVACLISYQIHNHNNPNITLCFEYSLIKTLKMLPFSSEVIWTLLCA